MLNTVLISVMLLPSSVADASFTIHPDRVVMVAKPGVLGVNAPDKSTNWAADGRVADRIREGGFRVVRLGLVQDGLYQHRDIYPSPRKWNFDATDKMLRQIFDAGAEPVVSIIGFPGGVPHELDADKRIVQADWKAYATFLKGVVDRYNGLQVLGKGKVIRYWELWNEPSDEPDGKFVSRAQYEAFAEAVTPTLRNSPTPVKIIGPVASWSDLGTDGWVGWGAKKLDVDILCWHNYGGQADQSDAERMAWPRKNYGDDPRLVLSGGPDGRFLNARGKHLGAAITEYNMSWADGSEDYVAKYRSNYNAAYVGASLIHAFGSGLDLFAFYVLTQSGRNNLGLVSNSDYQPYKPFHVFPLFASIPGSQLLATTGKADGLEILAWIKAGKTSIALVNSAPQAQSVHLTVPGRTTLKGQVRRVDASQNGEVPTPIRDASSLSLPPYSVTQISLS